MRSLVGWWTRGSRSAKASAPEHEPQATEEPGPAANDGAHGGAHTVADAERRLRHASEEHHGTAREGEAPRLPGAGQEPCGLEEDLAEPRTTRKYTGSQT